MQRYFIEKQINENELFTIENNDFHHIKNVMRSKKGDSIIVCNNGVCYYTELMELSDKSVLCKPYELISSQKKDFKVTIAQALIRRERFEYMLQKSTELGVDEITPITTINSIVKVNPNKLDSKVARWNTIVKEASEQSHRSSLALVNNVLSLKELKFNDYDIVLVAYEKEVNSNELKKTLSSKLANLLVVIGPEGGFDQKEIEFLSKFSNVRFVGLGPRILRSETASSYILSTISYEYEMIV